MTTRCQTLKTCNPTGLLRKVPIKQARSNLDSQSLQTTSKDGPRERAVALYMVAPYGKSN